ncbi:Mg-chelatase subunit ChlD [Kineococcus radiotolerans]|uniref:Mg-chelatase subunit ChlD n=1 Tax=Kineococcus radiotolerans TaxID=131568 RepID=A0A7W4TI64_KINRA|nr:VWA domain-containing protein [Kineococcus radiotolerans]MBB2899350.1 Mg-chelatase subunit ChlD [Kineococcus radiotolerans]
MSTDGPTTGTTTDETVGTTGEAVGTTGEAEDGALAPLVDDAGRARRWRLLLGDAADGCAPRLAGADAAVDAALAALYDVPDASAGTRGRRSAGLGGSAPRVARWLGDIRTYFPSRVVQVMQRDAVERLDLTRLLLEPELLGAVQPDVNLVGTLLSLSRVLPERTKETARQVVAEVVRQIEARVADRTTSAVTGALDRAARTHRPRLPDVDWNATIRANLTHYLPEHRTVVPERLVGHGRRQQVVAKEVVLEIDQSGSMAESVVYASVFGAVLAKMRTLKTTLIAFDTEVVDLTDSLTDPVDVLFGVQLGGGTDINRAIAYGQERITRPADTLFFLISDLFEGGVRDEMVKRMAAMKSAGVQVIVLLALSDSGAPAFDRENAAALAALGIPAFACTPDAFPDLLALAMTGGDVGAWAQREIAAAGEPHR